MKRLNSAFRIPLRVTGPLSRAAGKGIVIGVTGGFGTGKSTVLAMFNRLGAKVLDADRIYHELIQPGAAGWKRLVKAFGKAILKPDQSVDRQILGALVHAHPSKRKTLERITHPLVRNEIDRRIAKIHRTHPRQWVAVEIPLLVEAKAFEHVDVIVVVAATRRVQLDRLRRKYPRVSKAHLLRIANNQLPLTVKKKFAHAIVHNNGSRQRTWSEVSRLWKQLTDR